MQSPATCPALTRIRQYLQMARDRQCTLIMGVLNVTPDSFSDGGLFFQVDAAVAHAERMVAEGAHIIDVGGESTRPATFTSLQPLDPDEERRRILPVIARIRERLPEVPVSVDTYKAAVARDAVAAGAVLVNDISALRADPEMATTVAALQVPVCLMHMPGLPKAIPADPGYTDVVAEVVAHLKERAEAAQAAGIAPQDILVDPGIGFGKSVSDNLALLRRLPEIAALGYPVLIGTSRKSMIGKVLGDLPPEDRLEGTAATVALSIAYGATMVRVHDVRAMARVARMTDAIVRGWP
ncbi:MAG: dihydropteroate synthase [Chloroherpetonaceae bacterium]|nr:dihydropteroate synthase [Chthonomonadaceae bacterium]MDW8206563.1 dihydropteroate synthase [Chloroherpetonaceae bacterium]